MAQFHSRIDLERSFASRSYYRRRPTSRGSLSPRIDRCNTHVPVCIEDKISRRDGYRRYGPFLAYRETFGLMAFNLRSVGLHDRALILAWSIHIQTITSVAPDKRFHERVSVTCASLEHVDLVFQAHRTRALDTNSRRFSSFDIEVHLTELSSYCSDDSKGMSALLSILL